MSNDEYIDGSNNSNSEDEEEDNVVDDVVEDRIASTTTAKKTSSVWLFFDTNRPNQIGIPICKECDKEYAKGTGVSSLRRHLSTHSIIAPVKKQGTSREYHNNIPHSEAEQIKRDMAVQTWVICDLQSFNVVENKEWRDMVNTFDPKYRFHNRHTLKDQITIYFEGKKIQVKAMINQISGKVAFTADMWTSINNSAFLSLTIHYTDTNWKLKSFLLDIIPIPISVRHTGLNMAEALINIINEYNLGDRTLGLTTDNAASMIVCGRIIKDELKNNFNNIRFSHYRCAAHILNLAVQEGLQLIDEAVQKVRSLMKCLKSSLPLLSSLKALCDMKNINYLTPELDCATCWNSTYYMLQKFKYLQPALHLLQANERKVQQRYSNQNDMCSIFVIIIIFYN